MKEKPVYITIEEQIEKDISAGVYKSDSKLPTEREFMEKYNVSRMTIRQVISNLAGRGLVYRVKGKGAFVQKEIFMKNQNFRSITSLMAERGISVETRVLQFTVMIPEELVRLKLNLDELVPVYLVKRLRIAAGSPIAVEFNYLPCELYPDFEKHDFSKESMYKALENEYQFNISYQKEVVSAVKAPADVAKVLSDDEEDIDFTLKIENLVMNDDARPLLLGWCYYHPDRYSYFNVSSRK